MTHQPPHRSVAEPIAASERTNLQPADHHPFFAVLDTPPAPIDRLRAAFDRYREAVADR